MGTLSQVKFRLQLLIFEGGRSKSKGRRCVCMAGKTKRGAKHIRGFRGQHQNTSLYIWLTRPMSAKFWTLRHKKLASRTSSHLRHAWMLKAMFGGDGRPTKCVGSSCFWFWVVPLAAANVNSSIGVGGSPEDSTSKESSSTRQLNKEAP